MNPEELHNQKTQKDIEELAEKQAEISKDIEEIKERNCEKSEVENGINQESRR